MSEFKCENCGMIFASADELKDHNCRKAAGNEAKEDISKDTEDYFEEITDEEESFEDMSDLSETTQESESEEKTETEEKSENKTEAEEKAEDENASEKSETAPEKKAPAGKAASKKAPGGKAAAKKEEPKKEEPKKAPKPKKNKIPFYKDSRKITAVCICLFAVIVLVVILSTPAAQIKKAGKMINNGEYDNAMNALTDVIHRKGAFEQYRNAATAKGDEYLNEGDEVNAAIYYLKAGRPTEAEQIFDFNSMVMGYSYVTAGISLKGDTYYLTNREGDSQESGLAAVAAMKKFLPATAGINGIGYSGTPVVHYLDNTAKIYLSAAANEEFMNTSNVIYAISDTCPDDGLAYVVLLKKNGSVKIISDNPSPLTGMSTWGKIKSITDGSNKIFGIDYSGKLHIAYENTLAPEMRYNTSSFPALRKVVETGKAVVGLTVSGGMCVAYADTDYEYLFDFSSVKNATDIAADNNILVITFDDGSVQALRIPNWISDDRGAKLRRVDSVIRKVNRWKDIVRVRFAANGIYGIKYNGDVVFESCDIKYNTAKNKYTFNSQAGVKKLVSDWSNVVDVISCNTHAVAIRYDGTVCSTGNTDYLVKKYKGNKSESYTYDKLTDGTYCNVDDWQLW